MTDTIIFAGTRRTGLEVNAAVRGALEAGAKIALLAESPPEWSPCALAEFVRTDLFDRDAAIAEGVALARRTNAKGVVAWTDPGVEVAAGIASACGLPGLQPEAAHRARNKRSMRMALRDRPELMPRFRPVRTLDDLREAAGDVGFPGVLKPAGANGSKAIQQVHGPEQLEGCWARARALTSPEIDKVFGAYPGEFLYEERLGGSEHSVEGFVVDGEVVAAGITDKWVTEDHYLEYREIHPTQLPAEAQERVLDLARAVVAGLGLDWCAFHLECRVLATGEAKLLEIAARPGGGYIASHLVPLSTGIPFCANVSRVAMGERPDVRRTRALHAGGHSMLARAPGRFDGLEGLDEVLDLWGLEHFVWEKRRGAPVVLPPGQALSSWLASVIVCDVSYEEVEELLDRAADRARPRIGAG